MRKGYNFSFIHSNNGLVGISLGADHVSEHEWGIKGMRRTFGMQDDGIGLERRKIRAVPGELRWVEDKKYSGILLPSWEKYEIRLEGKFDEQEHLYTAWDERSFMVLADRDKEIGKLKEIHTAITKLDLCIWLGGGGIFQNAGLCFGIISKMDHGHLEAWAKGDLDRIQLLKDAEATGIEAKLKAAGKQWFALSPRRTKNGGVDFWLNPMDQSNNNYGQFTVEQLEQWIKGEGPIPMRHQQRRRR